MSISGESILFTCKPSPANHAWNFNNSAKDVNHEVYHPDLNPVCVLASAEYEHNLDITGACKIINAGVKEFPVGENNENRKCAYIIRKAAMKLKDRDKDKPSFLSLIRQCALFLRKLEEHGKNRVFTTAHGVCHGSITPKLFFLEDDATLNLVGLNTYRLALLSGEKQWAETCRPDIYTRAFRPPEKSEKPLPELDILDDIWSVCMSVLCISTGTVYKPLNIDTRDLEEKHDKIYNFSFPGKEEYKSWISKKIKNVEDNSLRLILRKGLELKREKRFKSVEEFFCECHSRKLTNILKVESKKIKKQSIPEKFLSLSLRVKSIKNEGKKRNEGKKEDHGLTPVLIKGPIGCGKNYLANNLHKYINDNRDAPFIKITGSDLKGGTGRSELFGYKEGSFTGANENRIGVVEAAKEGTLFIDEVDTLDHDMQTTLFSLFDTGEYRKIGENKHRQCECMIFMATNKNLEELVDEECMKMDFYSRITNGVTFSMPPVIERRDELRNALLDFYDNEKRKNFGSLEETDPESLAIFKSIEIPDKILDIFMKEEFPLNFRTASKYMGYCVELVFHRIIYGEKSELTKKDAHHIIRSLKLQKTEIKSDSGEITDRESMWKRLAELVLINPHITRPEAGIKINLASSNEKARNMITHHILPVIKQKEHLKFNFLADGQKDALSEWGKKRKRGRKTMNPMLP